MASSESPIACTLDIDDFRERLAQIAALNRDALRGYERDSLVLHLRYGAAAGVWIWRESVRSNARPARSTLYMMVVATFLLALAVAWPLIEPKLLAALRA